MRINLKGRRDDLFDGEVLAHHFTVYGVARSLELLFVKFVIPKLQRPRVAVGMLELGQCLHIVVSSAGVRFHLIPVSAPSVPSAQVTQGKSNTVRSARSDRHALLAMAIAVEGAATR